MSLHPEKRLVTATVELSRTVKVTVQLPHGVSVEDVDDATRAVDCVSALPTVLRSSLLAAAVAESEAHPASTTLADVHFMEVL